MAIDTNGIVTLINKKGCEVLGYEEREVVGRNWFDNFVTAETRAKIKPVSEMLLNGQVEAAGYFENPVLNRSGKERIIAWHSAVLRGDKGNIIGHLNSGDDITERKWAEEELKKNRKQMAAIRKSIPDLIMTLNGEGRYIDILSGEVELLYMKKENIIGRLISEVLPEDIAEAGLVTIRLALKTGTTQMMEYRLRVPAGERWFEGKISPVLSIDSGEKLVVMVARDITERKTLEEEHQKMERLESLGTLAGGIAHDFNNLLTAIMGNIQLAIRYIEPQSKAAARLNEANKASIIARDITRQLPTFSKGGAPVKRAIPIGHLIIDATRFALSGSRVKPVFSVADNLWLVEVDAGQIIQVITNIVINADEAMPGGGTLNIGAKNLTLKRTGMMPLTTGITPLKIGNYVNITIEDYGVGIPKKRLARIFEPYFTTKPKGSGLGLATSYAIIRNHGGYITVTSKTGAGTIFNIFIPALNELTTPEEEIQEMQTNNPGRGRVLVMDDDEIIRDMLSSMLSVIGYDVELSHDGLAAIKSYTEARDSGKPFNAVIMDLTIRGGMGGKEAVKKMLAIDPEAKVIVSSGYANDPILSEYKEYGFCAVVVKPYSISELEKTLRSI